MLKALILIHGKKRSGKDFVGSLIQEKLRDKRLSSKKIALADKMKKMISTLFNISIEELEEYKNQEKNIYVEGKEKPISNFRKILQNFGTEVIKKEFGKYVWVNFLIKEIEKSKEQIIIVPDVRFVEELEGLSFLRNYRIFIEDKKQKNTDSHISEKGLDKNLFNYIFDNTKKDLTEAKEFAERIALKISTDLEILKLDNRYEKINC